MAFRNKKEQEAPQEKEKVLDVDASMQGSMTFRDPVNLRINGKFEGSLDTKGSLTVGDHAEVHANIVGETIVVAGKVFGNVQASRSITLTQSAHLVGDVKTPRLEVIGGALLQGKCDMSTASQGAMSNATVSEMLMSVEELARYLEVDANSVADWAKTGRIPALKEGNTWKFDRTKVDSWIASERIK